MKNYQKRNTILSLAILPAIIFVFAQIIASAQQLKPTEIVYSRLQTNLLATPTGVNSPTIWAAGQDGSNDRQLTTGMQPRISDDGRFLLFKRFPGTANNPFGNPWGGEGQLWVRDLANNSETMIFSWGSSGYLIGYCFSPASNQGNYQIIVSYVTLTYRLNLDGTGAVPVPGQFERDYFPVVRRGDSLIVSHAQGGGFVTLTIETAIRTLVPNTLANDYNPFWSNDNQFIGYGTVFPANANPFNVASPYPYVFGKISKIKPDGSIKTQLADLTGGSTSGGTDGVAFGAIWTDDNSKVIVAARIGGIAGLYNVKTDGSGVYTRIPISNGNPPDWVGGIVQPRTDAQLISNGGGVMTDQGGNFTYDGNFTVNSDGTLSPVEPDVTQANQFSMVSSIGEPIAGDKISGGGFSFQSGFTPNTPPNIAGGTGQEGDVAGRPNGDGSVQSNDVVQVQRFQIGLDQPFLNNEFQRVDSAPYVSRGDGAIQANDVVQTQRFQIGLEQTQTAAGPVDYGTSRQAESDSLSQNVASVIAAPRELRVESRSASAGQVVTVNIRVDAAGDESAYGFTMNYDPAVFTAPTTSIGTAGGSRLCNTTVAGQIRCSIINFPDDQPGSSTDQIGEIAAGNNQLLMKVNFTVPAGAVGGPSAMTLSGVNASNDAAQNLTISSQNGTITVAGTTAAGVSVGGRVTTGSGKGLSGANVVIIDRNGKNRTVMTNVFGYFRFDDVRVGETYVVSVKAKAYSFTPQSVSVISDLSDLNFTVQP